MSTKTIKLEDSTAKKLYKTASPEFKTLLEENWTKEFFSDKIQDRIGDFDDILNELGVSRSEILPWNKATTKNKISQNGLAKIQAITEVYNGGKEEEWADWTNTSQPKYFLYWTKNALGGWVLDDVSNYYYIAYLGAGSYFKSRELAEDAAGKFKDVWIEYLPI